MFGNLYIVSKIKVSKFGGLTVHVANSGSHGGLKRIDIKNNLFLLFLVILYSNCGITNYCFLCNLMYSVKR